MPAYIQNPNYRALIYGFTIGLLILWGRLAFYAISSNFVPLGWHFAFRIIGTWAIMLFSTKLIYKSASWKTLFFISGFTGFLSAVISIILGFLLLQNNYELSTIYEQLLYALIYISIAEGCLAIYKKRS